MNNEKKAYLPIKKALSKQIGSLEKGKARAQSVLDSENHDTELPTKLKIETEIHSAKRFGISLLLIVFVGFGGWASLAPLDGAAHAPGTVTVRSYKKVVQHLEGGIVKSIHAENGDLVEAGSVLLKLDETRPLAELEMALTKLNAQKAREARLIAERNHERKISFPPVPSEASKSYSDEVAAQQDIFDSRLASREGEIEVFEQRIEQLELRLVGLSALKESKEILANSFEEELRDIDALLDQGFSDKDRLRSTERSLASYRGEAAELVASMSTAEVEIGEARLQIIQLDREFQNQVVAELADVQTALKDINEQIMILNDRVLRTTVRAPVTGVVNKFDVHTVGGVIGAGSELAEIVPSSEELILEAQVSALDIDRVAPGQEATIRFSSFGNKAPTIFGTLLSLSADAITDERGGLPFYLARVEVSSDGTDKLGDLKLVPGMPADIFISTGSRTLMQYMFKPFSNSIARSFIED